MAEMKSYGETDVRSLHLRRENFRQDCDSRRVWSGTVARKFAVANELNTAEDNEPTES